MLGTRVARLRREWNLQKVRALARYVVRRAGEDHQKDGQEGNRLTHFPSVTESNEVRRPDVRLQSLSGPRPVPTHLAGRGERF